MRKMGDTSHVSGSSFIGWNSVSALLRASLKQNTSTHSYHTDLIAQITRQLPHSRCSCAKFVRSGSSSRLLLLADL
jgi:hypothetical protein